MLKRNLFKNIPVLFALSFIVIISIASFLGYLITPDKTTNCDDQHLEIALLKPLTKIDFISYDSGKSNSSIFKTWHNGKPNSRDLFPVKEIRNDSIVKIIFYNQQVYKSEKNTQATFETTTKVYLLGTDKFGRDVFSRIILGGRITLLIGFIAVLISLVVGIFLGSLAGYYRGRMDDFISWLMSIVWSIPTLLLVLVITISFGKGLIPIFIAVGLTMWVDVARIVRGEIFSIREKEFILAGKALGYSSFRIILKHIFPSILPSILVIATSNFASAILIESGLSFLGLGAAPPTPTWGNMIEMHRNLLTTGHAYLALIPGFMILMLVLSFTVLSNSLKNFWK